MSNRDLISDLCDGFFLVGMWAVALGFIVLFVATVWP